MWRNCSPCVLVVGYKMMQLLWKSTWRFFKKAKHRIDVIQQFYFWVYPQKSRKQSLKQIFVPSCSQQKYSQEPKKWSNPTVHRQMNGFFFHKKKEYMHTMEYFSVLKRREGGRDKLEDWDNTNTLLYIKWITNKDLLFHAGNSTQYSVMAYKGKESKKE